MIMVILYLYIKGQDLGKAFSKIIANFDEKLMTHLNNTDPQNVTDI